MTTKPTTRILLGVNDPVPENMTTEEAAEFWDTHTPSRERIEAARGDPETQELMTRLRGGQERQSPRQPRQPKATHITTLRLDEDMEQRLKRVAAIKKVPYQTLLKQFVGERLYEEEKRLGVV
jgi:predicted DNA binding CopG/RHH family protein